MNSVNLCSLNVLVPFDTVGKKPRECALAENFLHNMVNVYTQYLPRLLKIQLLRCKLCLIQSTLLSMSMSCPTYSPLSRISPKSGKKIYIYIFFKWAGGTFRSPSSLKHRLYIPLSLHIYIYPPPPPPPPNKKYMYTYRIRIFNKEARGLRFIVPYSVCVCVCVFINSPHYI